MYKYLRDVPTGVSVTVVSGFLKCEKCGAIYFGPVNYDAKATDEYRVVNGRVERLFTFDGNNPFCGCTDGVWLWEEDGPYVIGDWPMRKAQIERPDDG